MLKRALIQDLHIHTTFSSLDSAVVNEQTPEFVASVKHADIIGISDHFEHFDDQFELYENTLKNLNLHVGTEIDGADYVADAVGMGFEYFIYHCRDNAREYKALELLLETRKPVIVAHPMMMGTDLNKIPGECYIELNNRYIWQFDWRKFFTPFKDTFPFVISSDAHQPNWLNQNVARYVANELEIEETLIFNK
jgi:histidinol phosphatase-like PHP family hydrolase